MFRRIGAIRIDKALKSLMTLSSSPTPAARALLPIGLFLILFIGSGLYYQSQGAEFAFYQLPGPVAVLPAILLAVLLHQGAKTEAVEQFLAGAGHSNIMAMCMIFLLAGAFSAVAKATGSVDATVALGLYVLPGWFVLPGLFIISAFIATAMGTSMGTIGAVAPIALGLAESLGIPLPMMAGAVIGGAMFGDNLSIISDTTIAATRTQGCEMRDKFRENFRIALPAAVIAVIVFTLLDQAGDTSAEHDIELLKVLPYLMILALALAGINVYLVLVFGIVAAGVIGFFTTTAFGLAEFAGQIYTGFGSMQEIFILSILIGGLGALVKAQGGLEYIRQQIERLLQRFSRSHSATPSEKAAEFGISALAACTNLCVANNTVAIIISGDVARSLSERFGVTAKRSASLLDIAACVIQGILPYGAQALLLGSIFKLSPVEIVLHNYYAVLLALAAIAAMILRHRTRIS